MSYSRWKDRDEAELLSLARERLGPDRSAARSELLRRYVDSVYQWCFRYAGDHDGAMDLAQQVLLRAHQKLDGFEGRSKFSSWLFAVTRTVCLNAMQRVTLDRDPEFDLERLADEGDDPLAELVRRDDREHQLRLMREVLDETEQEAMALRYFEQLTPDEITRILGLTSRSGARGVLQRARRKLVAAVARGSMEGSTDA